MPGPGGAGHPERLLPAAAIVNNSPDPPSLTGRLNGLRVDTLPAKLGSVAVAKLQPERISSAMSDSEAMKISHPGQNLPALCPAALDPHSSHVIVPCFGPGRAASTATVPTRARPRAGGLH